jgi:lysophospholipid acyltransferase (LPLAT)-like uncharacterized protein
VDASPPRRADGSHAPRRRLTAGARLGLRLAAWLFRALAASQRLLVVGSDPTAGGRPIVAAVWHNVLFLGLGLFRDRGVVLAASRARAGDRTSALLTHLGYGAPVRGSSSRAPVAALAGMIRAAQGGSTVGVTVDGGHGPAGKVRPGVLAVARASGHPVYPLGLAARPCLRVRSSWETVIVPLPFSRVAVVVGEPLVVPRDASKEELERLRVQLEQALHGATQQAEAALR